MIKRSCEDKNTIWDFVQTNAKDFKVIGTIHDNPELLREGADNG